MKVVDFPAIKSTSVVSSVHVRASPPSVFFEYCYGVETGRMLRDLRRGLL